MRQGYKLRLLIRLRLLCVEAITQTTVETGGKGLACVSDRQLQAQYGRSCRGQAKHRDVSTGHLRSSS
eukprot:25260-Eustigmatos_ZCMA.PRE.1